MDVILTDYKSTKAWGVNPASASGTYIIADGENAGFVLKEGASITYSGYGIDVFYGVVSSVKLGSDFSTGKRFTFEAVDNRIRLQWMMCFCAFNVEDEMCGHGLQKPIVPERTGQQTFETGGDDAVSSNEVTTSTAPDAVRFPEGYVVDPAARRRFKSLLPENADSGIWTYHTEPFTAAEILNICFKGAVGHKFGFTRIHHTRSHQCRPLNMDFQRGATLANVITALNEKSGLDVYLEDKSKLYWGIKGEGAVPIFSAADPQTILGKSITSDPTRLRVMGSGSMVQVLNIELFYNWNRKWEQFLGEHAWLVEVAEVWAIDPKKNWADVAALAREVTLFDYCKKKGDDTFADYGSFGSVSRMNMSALIYMQEVVFKSYSLPSDRLLFGEIPHDSLKISQNLLCAVEMVDDGLVEDSTMRYQRSPVEFYPGTRAFAMVLGQPLDAIDAKDVNTFVNLRTADMRKTWRVVQDYDIEDCGVAIRFRQPVFVDGDAEKNESIFAYPNKGEVDESAVAGLDPTSELLRVVVPNAKFKITPARVKVSLCFDIAPFYMEYGSGPRYGVLSADGLAAHVLHGDTAFSAPGVGVGYAELIRLPSGVVEPFSELLYADGKSAKEKSFEAWQSREGYSAFQIDGSYTRKGSVGARLGGTIDRISVSIDFSGGITETVDFVKARTSKMFFGEKTMARLQRMGELYTGHESNKREIRNLKRISAANRYAQAHSRSSSHQTVNDVFNTPIGGGMANQSKVVNMSVNQDSRGDKAKVGDVMWADSSGDVAAKGKSFLGVAVLAKNESKNGPVAYAGTVPVRLKGEFTSGQAVYVERGNYYGSPVNNGDAMLLGIYTHSDSPSDKDSEYLGLVRIGFITDVKNRPYVPSFRKLGNAWQVSFTLGYVIERVSNAGDGLLIHETKDILDDKGEVKWHDIAVGQTAYVFYLVNGSVGNVQPLTNRLIVTQNGMKSTAYKPKCDEVAIDGIYWYPLFEFALVNDAPKIVSKHVGQNIIHYAERVDVVNLGDGEQKVFKGYSQAIDALQFRTFRSVGAGKRILKKEIADTIDVRTITGSGDSPSDLTGIEVVDDDPDMLRVKSKGATGKCDWLACDGKTGVLIKVKDGLVEEIANLIKVGECNVPSSSSNNSIS